MGEVRRKQKTGGRVRQRPEPELFSARVLPGRRYMRRTACCCAFFGFVLVGLRGRLEERDFRRVYLSCKEGACGCATQLDRVCCLEDEQTTLMFCMSNRSWVARRHELCLQRDASVLGCMQ